MKKVLLVCSEGMSSAIVVKAIEKEAQKHNIELEVKAVGTGEYEDEVRRGWNIVLVAPQVRHRMPVFEQTANELNIPTVPKLAELVAPHVAKILFPFRLTVGLTSLYASYGIGYSQHRNNDCSLLSFLQGL